MSVPVMRATSLYDAWKIQRRVIWALFLREILTRYGRHNIGLLWLFGEPMLFTVGVTLMWIAFGATHGSDLPITAFAVSGYSTVLIWRNMASRCVAAIHPNSALLYHRNVKVLSIFISRMMVEAGGATLSMVLLTVLFSYMEWMSLPENVLMVALGWSMLIWFSAALAIFLGALSEFSELVERFWHPIGYFLLPVSGAGYLVDALPPEAQRIILILPLAHGTEMVREGFFGSKVVSHYDVGYMSQINLVLTFVGLLLTSYVSRRVTPE